MFVFSYGAILCAPIGLILAVLALRPGRSSLNWCVAVSAIAYALYCFCYVWIYGASDKAVVWTFFYLSTTATTIILPATTLANLLIAGVPLRRAILWCLPFAACWIGLFLWPFFQKVVFVDFVPTPWGNTYIAPSDLTFYKIGYTVELAQKLLVWTILWRARSRTALKRMRRMLTLFVPLDIAATLLIAFVGTAAHAAGLPAVEGFTGLAGLGLIFFMMRRYQILRNRFEIDFRQTASLLKEGLIEIDATLRVTSANHAAQRLGVTPGHNLAERFSSPGAVRELWKRAVETRQSQEGTGRLDGDVQLTLSPAFNPFGDLVGGLAMVRRSERQIHTAAERFGLTPAEQEVLVLLLQGHDRKAIAGLRFIAEGTVKAHIHSIYAKTGAKNRVELMLRL